jgi:hypothetical protein
MNRKRLGIILILLTATLFLPVQAATLRRLTLEDLVEKADCIVIGRVVGSHTFRSPDQKLILTRHTLEIQQSLKGNPSPTMEVTTIGGQIGDTILQVAGMPSLTVGESMVLFLKPAGAYTTVLGWQQGKYSIRNGQVTNSAVGLSFSDGLPGKTVVLSVEEFKRQIQQRMGR